MDFLYFLVKGTETYQPDADPIRLLQNYFETEGAFTSAFIIALIVALVGLLIFYGIFGMKVYRMATHKVYWSVLVIVGVITFAITQFSVVGSEDAQSGFFASAETSEYIEDYLRPLSEAEQQEAIEQRDELEDKMDGFCDVVITLDLINAVYSVLIFFLLSIVVKNATVHAKKIPF